MNATKSAVNRADLLQVQGKYPNQTGPVALGLECAGHVIESGSSAFKEGDAIMALLDGGGYSEFVDVSAQMAIGIDETRLGLDRAGAIPETFLTAFQLLHFVGETRPDSRVIIHGAGSGVGTAAIQLAKAAGCKEIYATWGINDTFYSF